MGGTERFFLKELSQDFELITAPWSSTAHRIKTQTLPNPNAMQQHTISFPNTGTGAKEMAMV